MSDAILGMSNDEIVAAAQEMGLTDSSTRVVGVYYEGSIDVLSAGFFGAGGEYVRFVGVDLDTGERVVANYGGLSVGGGVSRIPNTNVGGGAFGFTGEPSALGGWSAGGQLSAGVTTGASINLDGSGVLYFAGADTSIGFNGAVGYTYRVRVGNDLIYNFGTIDTGLEFDSLSVASEFIFGADNRTPTGGFRENEFTYEERIEGTSYTLVQEVRVLNGVANSESLSVYSSVVDEFGNPVSGEEARAILEQYGRIQNYDKFLDGFGSYPRAFSYFTRDENSEFFERGQECFGPEVPIDMWPLDPEFTPDPNNPFKQYDQDAVRAKIWKKPIHKISVGDWVVSHDKNGNMVPGYVPRTMINDAKILLDFHGTAVTSGHVYYRPDSKRADKYETLIDVLRDDGMIEDRDGVKLRAATYAPVDGPLDKFVQAVTGTLRPDGGVDIKEQGRIRLGTRFIVRNDKGRKDYSVADLIEAGGGVVGDDELIRVGDGPGIPFHWDFADTLPKPEDFVLAASGTTLEDIYKAAEWESQGPRLPAPMMLDGGPVQPLKGAELSVMPRNEPLNLGHTPEAPQKPQRMMNRKQRKAMEAKSRKAAKARKRAGN